MFIIYVFIVDPFNTIQVFFTAINTNIFYDVFKVLHSYQTINYLLFSAFCDQPRMEFYQKNTKLSACAVID